MNEAAQRTRDFYLERIPAQFERALEAQALAADRDPEAARLLKGMQAATTTLCVVVDDDPENARYLNIEAGHMRVADRAAHPVLLSLAHASASIDAIEREAGDSALGFLGAVAGLGVEIKLTARRIEELRAVEGSVRFELRGESGFAIDAAFGGAPLPCAGREPTCQLALEQEAYARLRSGELDIQEAFMTGQVEVTGDMQVALQLALAVVAPD